MNLDHGLVATATEKLRLVDRETQHDARNLITRYVGLSELAGGDAEARARLPKAERQMRDFVVTGRVG